MSALRLGSRRVCGSVGAIRRVASTSSTPPSTSAPPASPSSAAATSSPAPASESSATRKPSGLLARLLSPSSASGKSPLLSALGYYSAESRAIGAANRLYAQAVEAAENMPASFHRVSAEGVQTRAPFVARFEMLSLHIYVVLRRLRQERGAPHEGDVKKAMQTLFDVFWTDVRNRMLIEEEGFKLINSAKWVKECEQRFFGLALAIDDCLEIESGGERQRALSEVLGRNITCLESDEVKVESLAKYTLAMLSEHDRATFEAMWEEGLHWGKQG